MLQYRGYLIVPGWNATTGVRHFSLRVDGVNGGKASVFHDRLDGHFATEGAAIEALTKRLESTLMRGMLGERPQRHQVLNLADDVKGRSAPHILEMTLHSRRRETLLRDGGTFRS